MIACIKNLIKYCITGNSAKDSGKYSIQQTDNGNVKDTCILYPYGMHANAPSGSFGINFNIQGKEENSAAIITSTNQRTKGLKEGEVEFGNQLVGSLTFYDESGNITATAQASYTINATDLTVNCNTQINGTLDTTGTITGGADIDATGDMSCVNLTASGTVQGATLTAGDGASGSFTTTDGKTVTVTSGVITSIV